MTDEERIQMVFQDFVDGGLVSQDIDQVFGCISDRVIGIGIGEQALYRSKQEGKNRYTVYERQSGR